MTNTIKSIKGQTREYRKALRNKGASFPLMGAFHLTKSIKGFAIVVHPSEVKGNETIVPGAAPHIPKAPNGWDVIDTSVEDTPLPPLPIVYKRTERISPTDGRKRVDYKPVKNPKGGERYWIKREVNGKQKWVEVSFSSLLAA